MAKFSMTGKASKEALDKINTSGGFKRLKIGTNKVFLLVLGEVHEGVPAVFRACYHERYINSRLVGRVASPSFTGEDDKIAKLGWELKEKYKDDGNDKLKNLWQSFMPKRNVFVNVLDLKNIDEGALVYQMSGAVSEVVLDEMSDLPTNEDGTPDLTGICDFDQGRPLIVKPNGKSGLQKRYTCKFSAKTSNLIENGKLDEEAINEIASKTYNLHLLQPAFNSESFEAYFEKLRKYANSLGVDLDDLNSDTEEELEDDLEKDTGEIETEELDDDELDSDVVSDDDLDDLDDEEFDKKPVKKAKKKAKKKTRG